MPKESQKASSQSPAGSTSTLRRMLLSWIAPYLFLALVLVTISLSFGQAGGIDDFLSALCYEAPYLLVAFSALLYLLRPGFWRVVVAAFPFIVLYVTIDLYYIYLQSVFKLDDLLILSEGLNVAPAWVKVGAVVAPFIWVAAFAFLLKRRPRELALPLLLFIFAAVPPVAAYKIPKQFLHVTESIGLEIMPWSDRWTSALMGRSASLLLFAAAKHKALDELALLPLTDGLDRDPALLKNALGRDRNIHILVLESFLDPQRFSGLKFQTPLAPPKFDAVRKKLHEADSPVFGGGTAQAEFEVLCGAPAMQLYTAAEFNMLDGTSIPCLPNLLAGAGYRTVATQSYIPEFFNSEKAYRSLGFQEVNYPTVFAGNRPTYLKYDLRYWYMYDGDLLTQNLGYVEKLLAGGRPFLNYVLGIYGHMPHDTDTVRFPPKVDVVGVEKKSQAYRAIQQFYYRAGEVADYLEKLRKMDPDGLILVTSDHLPPLDRGTQTYKNLGYTLESADGEYKKNIWMYDGPRRKDAAWPTHYYAFMDFLLDNLTEGRFCQQVICKHREAWAPEKLTASYNNLMAQGSGILKKPAGLVAGAHAGLPPATPASPPPAQTPRASQSADQAPGLPSR